MPKSTSTLVPHPYVEKGDLNTVKQWASQCRDVDEMNAKQETALLVSSVYNQIDIAKFLLKKGASTLPVDIKGYNALHYALVNQNFEMCELLLSNKADPSFPAPNGNSTISLLVSSPCEHEDSQIKLIQTLLKGGSKINEPNKNSQTSIHLACLNSSINVLKTLIKAKGDPNVQLESGETAVHLATKKGREEIVALLCAENDSNIISKTNSGETALSIAKKSQPHLVPMLEAATRKQIPWKQAEIKGKWPIPRCNNSVSVFNNRMFIYGGQNDFFDPSSIYQDLAFLNGETLEWQCLSSRGNPPPALCGHTSVILKQNLFIFGGSNSKQHFNTIHKLDLGVMMWSPVEYSNEGSPYLISPRIGHTATEISDVEFLVFGGSCEEKFYNDLHIYNCETNTWKLIKASFPENTPAPRHYHTASLIGRNLFIYGGFGENQFYSDITVLNIDSWEWQKVEAFGKIPDARMGHASVVINNRLILVFGGTIDNVNARADLYAFDVETLYWIKYDSISSEQRQAFRRVGHSICNLNYRLYSYGGNSMFIIHELLSNVLDSQALLDSPRPTSPPSIPPKLPSSTSMNSPSLQQLKNEFNELTTMLKEQLGFSDQSAVMKKCSSIELLLNEIVESPKPSPVPAKSPLANNTVTIKRKSTLSNATPSIPPKPQSVKEKTFTPPPPFIQDSRNFQSSPELQRAAAVSVSEPNQVITPYKPPQKSESSENLFDKKTPFKPASEFGNMSSPSSRKKRSKTTKDSMDLPVVRKTGKGRKSGIFLSMRAKEKVPPSTVVEGSQLKSSSLTSVTDKQELSKSAPASSSLPKLSAVAEIQQTVLAEPSKPVKPLYYYKKLTSKIPPRKQISTRLDKTQKLIAEIFNEFINTEENYLRSLSVIIGLYKNPLENEYKSLVSNIDYYIPLIFGNVEDLFSLNLSFYEIINSIQITTEEESSNCDPIPTIIEGFQAVTNKFVQYNAYCTNHSNALETVDLLRQTNQNFAEFAENVKNLSESRREDLSSYLTKPFQRITRYPLFLEQIIKYCEDPKRKSILIGIKNDIDAIVHKANETKRVFDSVVKMIEIQSNFIWQGEDGQIKFSKDCKYVCEGKFKFVDVKSLKVSKRHFFLFSEMLVVAKTVGKKFKKQAVVPLETCIVVDNYSNGTSELPKNVKYAFTLMSTCGALPLIMGTSNDIEKQNWIAAITKAVNEFCVPNFLNIMDPK